MISVMEVLLGFETKAVLDTDDFFCSGDTSTPARVIFQHRSKRNMASYTYRDYRNMIKPNNDRTSFNNLQLSCW